MRKSLTILVLLTLIGLTACEPRTGQGKLMRDPNGMILGDDTQPAQALYIGAGDTATRLMARNPYLQQLQLSDQQQLRLPLMTRLDVHYDDGDIRLLVKDVCTANVDGDERFPGAAFIGIGLCEQPLNDWRPAVQKAVEILHRLEQQNPQIQNLRSFYTQASEAELQKIGGYIWEKSYRYVLITPEEAEAKFAEEEANGHEKIMNAKKNGRGAGSLAFIGVYAGKRSIFQISVDKTTHFGGDNLTEEQRRTMRYKVTMHFRLRNDVDPMSVQR